MFQPMTAFVCVCVCVYNPQDACCAQVSKGQFASQRGIHYAHSQLQALKTGLCAAVCITLALVRGQPASCCLCVYVLCVAGSQV